MGIQTYWPSLANIEDCILSEAERLSDKLLLSVHHPMKLVATPYGSKTPVVKSQQDLLEQLLANNNIIPLLGESGSGKSHLIRWLHAVANNHPKAKQERWHIIRIPKNASLSQVLEILLRDLEGDIFDNAREQVGKVANSLDYETTKNLMFAHIVEAFREVPARLQKQSQELQFEGAMTQEKMNQFMAEMSFADELKHFFDDPYIKESFSRNESAIRSRVSRLIEIKSYAELLEDNFYVVEDDFKFTSGEEISTQLGAKARKAYANLQLESDESKRKMAAEMTNKAIERACKLMFNRLFQFSTGNFQDLFKEIRRYLLEKNRTLVVLVEDLAAISSIDDVLIESLLEQDKDSGVQVLCPMKSVIATTDDLDSYKSHRNTIWTRGRFEWHLPTDFDVENFPELKFSTDDVVDFCARYINAARHGMSGLNDLIDLESSDVGLPVWQTDLEESERAVLADFGFSSSSTNIKNSIDSGIPLFPYNRQAITKLTQKHVFMGNSRTRFNPRVVIQEVLLAILRDHRERFIQNGYPSVWFEEQLSEFRNDDTAILVDQRIQDKEGARRLIGFMSLYTDATNSGDCFKQVSKKQAQVFGLDVSLLPEEISLEATGEVVVKQRSEKRTSTWQESSEAQDISREREKTKTQSPRATPQGDDVVQQVNEWFSKRSTLEQTPSNRLRLALYEMLEQQKGFSDYSLNANSVWGRGKESLIQATLKQGKLTLIELPGSRTNPDRSKVKAFGETELSDSMDSLILKKQMTAILRFATLNKLGERDTKDKKIVRVGWSYEQGLEDYALYMQFAQKWVPVAMARCVELAKDTAHHPLSDHAALANSMGFDLSGTDKALNHLVKTSKQVKSELPTAINEQHRHVFDKWLEEWDELRTKWLNTMLIGTNNAIHPVTFGNVYRNRDKKVRSASELKAVVREVKDTSASLKEHLEGSETKEELLELLELLSNSYKKIPAEMMPDYEVSIKTVRSRIKQLSEIVTSHTPKSAIAISHTQDDPVKLLNKINGDELDLWIKVLNDWKHISPKVDKNIRTFNDRNGANQIESYKKVINDRLLSLEESLQKLGAAHES